MAIGIGVPLKVTVQGVIMGQVFNNVQWYVTDGAAFLTADAVGVGEAFWNDIKTVWRAAMATTADLTTRSIKVSEPGPTGAFGEYAIPPGEQQGTRTATSALMPSFNAAGFRQTVATRTTRPGQKRIVGQMESDVSGQALEGAYITLINAIAPKFCQPIILGAPVATGVLIPVIVKLDAAGEVIASQEVTGFVTNPDATSQVSRKRGRGI